MTAPADREFRIFRRGEIRESILNYFRDGLRRKLNPETANYFTEDEIATATMQGTRWYRQAQAVDDYAQGEQRRALFLKDQIQIDRACSQWLLDYHGNQWDPDGKLPASGSSCVHSVRVTAPAGTHVIGSTTPGDPTAYWGRSTNGKRFQVSENADVPGGGTYVDVSMIAIDTGAETNIQADDTITWAFKDPSMSPTSTVLSPGFSGGANAETDAEWADRMISDIRHKPGGGNDAQQRSWARKVSSSVENAFIYPIAQGAGTVLIAITQKRQGVTGPNARVANAQTLALVTAYLTPPASPVEPSPPLIVVTTVQTIGSSVAINLALPTGSASGFTDSDPFPTCASVSAGPTVTDITGNVVTITCPNDTDPRDPLFSATHQPHILFWNSTASEFVELNFGTSLRQTGGTGAVYTLTLTDTPPTWLTVNTVVSPEFAHPADVAQAIIEYFDERGPGELFVAGSTDVRAHRCIRFPSTSEEYPCKAGSEIATRVIEVLGGTSVDAVGDLTVTDPGVPTDFTAGPNMLVLTHVGIYPPA